MPIPAGQSISSFSPLIDSYSCHHPSAPLLTGPVPGALLNNGQQHRKQATRRIRTRQMCICTVPGQGRPRLHLQTTRLSVQAHRGDFQRWDLLPPHEIRGSFKQVLEPIHLKLELEVFTRPCTTEKWRQLHPCLSWAAAKTRKWMKQIRFWRHCCR